MFLLKNDFCIPKNEIIFFLEKLYLHASLKLFYLWKFYPEEMKYCKKRIILKSDSRSWDHWDKASNRGLEGTFRSLENSIVL